MNKRKNNRRLAGMVLFLALMVFSCDLEDGEARIFWNKSTVAVTVRPSPNNNDPGPGFAEFTLQPGQDKMVMVSKKHLEKYKTLQYSRTPGSSTVTAQTVYGWIEFHNR